MNNLTIATLLMVLGIGFACGTTTPTDSSPLVQVNAAGEIRVAGKTTSFEALSSALLDTLLKMESLPEEISVSFDDEVLMGTRGEVRTTLEETLEVAQSATSKPVVVSLTYFEERGTDCDRPDSLQNNCSQIDFSYPKVYWKGSALGTKIDRNIKSYLTSILSAGGELQDTTSIEEAANVFWGYQEEMATEDIPMAGFFAAESSFETLMNTEDYLTIEMLGYAYMGGAHGSPTAYVFTYDLNTGSILSFDDIVKDKEALREIAEAKFREERQDAFEQGFDFDDLFEFTLPYNFGLTEAGVYFHYMAYEVGPYALGATTFTLSYDEIKDILKEPFVNW